MHLSRGVNSKYSFLIMVIPLFYILMPRPAISGIHFLTYPSIVVLVFFIVINATKDIRVNKNMLIMFAILFFSALIMTLSMWMNSTFAIDHLAKPILFGACLFFGYFITKNKDIGIIKKSLLKVAYIVIFAQLIIGVTQLMGVDVFGSLYSTEKTRPWGTIVRIAGTMSNPNIFAWIVLQMSVVIWLFEKKKMKKFVWVGIGLCLVFLSGSRSMLVLFPVTMLFIEIFTQKKNAVFFLFKIPLCGVVFYGMYQFVIWFLVKFEHQFPYMSQLLDVLNTGSLDSINSFYHRQFMWENALMNMDSIFNWLFGLGGVIEKADNDYVFSVANFGFSFMALQLLLYSLIVYFFFKIKDRKLRALGVQYILFSLMIGYQADTLSGWNYPILIMFYAGIAISVLANKKLKENDGILDQTAT